MTPIRFGLAGVVLLLAGVAYGIVYVNVPYPDPTPAQILLEKHHMRITDTLILCGVAVIFLAGLWGVGRKLRAWRKR